MPTRDGTVSLPGSRDSFNRFRVTCIRGNDVGQTYEATSEECSIGTSRANQLVLNDPLVSGHHCVIRAAADGAMILDLGSTNGTQVGGLRIDAAYLTNGLTVELGETVLRFEVLDERISPILSESDHCGGLYGISAAMRRIFALVEKIAESDLPILLEGETGVGKSSLARLIHESADRGELVAIDLSVSTTGAIERLAEATGTVVLEDIDQLDGPLQRALSESLESGALAVRIIATTQTDLREAVNSKRFRPDLYYQLSATKIRIPPLRERREDIPPLVERFWAAMSDDEDPAPPAELLERLFWRPWPGNVRELRAAVERAALGESELWEDGDEPRPGLFEFEEQLSYRESKDKVVGQFERWYAAELIRRHGGNLSRAARSARMDRSYLRELLRRHGIPLPSAKREK